MEIIWAIVAVIVVVTVAQIAVSVAARRQAHGTLLAPPQSIADIVESHFGSVWWRRVEGPGDFNYQAKGVGMGSYGLENPVISINLEVRDDGTTIVSAWMSEWASRLGIVGAADRIYFKRRSLIRKLEALDSVNAGPSGVV